MTYEPIDTGPRDGDADKTVTPDGIAGVADHIVRSVAELQTAFSNLSVGDTVYIAQGTYTVSSTPIINTDGVSVYGAGMGETTIKVADNTRIYPLRVGNNSAVSNIHLEGFTVDGNGSNQSNGSTTAYNTLYHGVDIRAGNDILVRRVEVSNTFPNANQDNTAVEGGASGIRAWGDTSRVTIEKCYTHDCDFRGIDIFSDVGFVTECVSTDNADRGISCNQQHLEGTIDGNGIIIANNYATGGTFPAAGIVARDGSTNVAILNNYVTPTTEGNQVRRGIALETHNHGVIAGNIVDATRMIRYGIQVNDAAEQVAVTNNVVYSTSSNADNPRGGIAVFQGGSSGSDSIDAPADNVVISSNSVDIDNFQEDTTNERGNGIVVRDGATNVTITDNNVFCSNTTGNKGLSAIAVLDGSTNVSIVGNFAQAANRNQVQIRDSSGNVSVVGNTIESLGSGSGVAVQGSNGNFAVVGNTVLNAAGAGVFGNNGQGFIVSGNLIQSPGSFGVNFNGGSWALVSGNVIQDAGGDGVATSATSGMVANNIIQSTANNGIHYRNTASDTHFRSNFIRNTTNATWVIDSSDGTFQGNIPDPGTAAPNGSPVNGEAVESASAESPQGSYPTGTLVRFTDSDDGSGTGTYLVARDGTSVRLTSNT